MTEDGVNKRAQEIVNKLIVFNKIKVSVKNIWAEEIINYLMNEKQDYNLLQHSKIIKAIPTYPADEGIAQLLEMLANVNSVPEENVLEDKSKELPPREQWEVDFNYMNFDQQRDKVVGWLRCPCPEQAIPKFVMDWVRELEDESLVKVMRANFKEGRTKWSEMISVCDIAKNIE